MIYIYISKPQSDFGILWGFFFHIYAKFRKNKALGKISKITVSLQRNKQNKLTKCDESLLYFHCS